MLKGIKLFVIILTALSLLNVSISSAGWRDFIKTKDIIAGCGFIASLGMSAYCYIKLRQFGVQHQETWLNDTSNPATYGDEWQKERSKHIDQKINKHLIIGCASLSALYASMVVLIQRHKL